MRKFWRDVRETPAEAWLAAMQAWLLIRIAGWISLSLLGVIR